MPVSGSGGSHVPSKRAGFISAHDFALVTLRESLRSWRSRMPRGGDRRGLRLTDGRDLRLASLLLQAMSLYESKHRRIIKGLAHHKPDGRNRFPQSPAQLAERLGRFRRPLRNDTVRTTRVFSAARVASTSARPHAGDPVGRGGRRLDILQRGRQREAPGAPEAAPRCPGVGLMAGFFSTLVCLNEAEFQAAGPALELGNIDQQGMQCLLDELGGVEGLTALMDPAAGPPLALFGAAVTCNLELTADPVAAP